ncbi:MAG: acyltransferase [Ruminococcaceae bacterium]|nr:acyltransferase [Oscillospiraceae bacterium]
MRRKLSEISAYESVLCLLVIMIHVLSDSINGYPKGSFLSGLSFIFSRTITFVVPAFIISSGIKFTHTYTDKSFNYFSFLKRRITKIYFPYLIMATIYYLYFVFHRHYFPFSFGALFKYLSLGTIAAPFYFVIIIMQLYLIAPITYHFCRNISPVVGLVLAAIITIVSKYLMLDFRYSDRIFLGYFIYWIIGCYMGLNFDMNLERLKRSKSTWIILGLVFTALYSGIAYMEFLNWFHSFWTEVLKIAFASFASIMWLLLMPEYQHEGADIVSPATFYIYLIHCLVIFEAEHLMDAEHWNITSTPVRFVIIFFSAYIVSILLSVIYSRIKMFLGHFRR